MKPYIIILIRICCFFAAKEILNAYAKHTFCKYFRQTCNILTVNIKIILQNSWWFK